MRKTKVLVHYAGKGIRILTNPPKAQMYRAAPFAIVNPSKSQEERVKKEGAHRLKIKNKKLYLEDIELRKHNFKLLGIAMAVIVAVVVAHLKGVI